MGSIFQKIALIAFLIQSAAFFAHADELPLLKIQSKYIGEEKGLSQAPGAQGKFVKYLTSEEQAEHLLKIKDGKFYRGANQFDSSAGTFTYAEGEGVDHWSRAIIVLDENENLYTSLHKEEFKFHHSTLNAGKPVKFAGDMIVKDGVLVKFTNNSGHYIPSVKHVHQFMQYLEKNGVDISKVQFDLNQGSFAAFFDSKPNQREIQQLSDYTLEEALHYISQHPDESWFELYRARIQEALENHPQGLKHLINTLDYPLSDKAMSAVLPGLKKHASEIFITSDALTALSNHFKPQAYQEILETSVNQILEKAKKDGLRKLNRVEIQSLGMYQKAGRVSKVDEVILELAKTEYPNRITAEHLDDLYGNMRLWNLEHMDQFMDKTAPVVANPGQCDVKSLSGFLSKIFSRKK